MESVAEQSCGRVRTVQLGPYQRIIDTFASYEATVLFIVWLSPGLVLALVLQGLHMSQENRK